jgi:tRNA nucleotidyltransferase (CCA-adding enzyme)
MAEISSKRDLITGIPGERIKMEFDRILLSPRSAQGVGLLFQASLLLTIFPEMKGLKNLGQGKHHHLDALSHTLLTLEKIPSAIEWLFSKGKEMHLGADDLLALHYATLFHDMGKQDTSSEDETHGVHFYHHELFSCKAAEGIMERLRFPNVIRNRILRLIANHMRIHNLPEMTKEPALKHLVHRLGDETPLLVLHTFADKEASRGTLSIQKDEVVEALCLRMMKLFHQEEIVHPPLLINGHDVMALGYSPGPRVGHILNFIRGKQIVGEIRTREEALGLLKDKFGLDG